MDAEEEDFVFYGTPIEREEDASSRKKKAVAKATGQLHGAFTGGYSAGYYNTVGSKEGWTPQSFKSSRKKRAEINTQSVDYFLDDDEKAELEARSFATSAQFDTFGFTSAERARKHAEQETRNRPSPIPGPIPDVIVVPVTESVGVRFGPPVISKYFVPQHKFACPLGDGNKSGEAEKNRARILGEKPLERTVDNVTLQFNLSDTFTTPMSFTGPTEAVKPGKLGEEESVKYPKREESQWMPSSLLCKRFDFTAPFLGKLPPPSRPRSKMDTLILMPQHVLKSEHNTMLGMDSSFSQMDKTKSTVDEDTVDAEIIERPIDLYKAIFSDDDEENNNRVVVEEDPGNKVQVANKTLNRLIAGDFLESLGKELGLEVPPDAPCSESKDSDNDRRTVDAGVFNNLQSASKEERNTKAPSHHHRNQMSDSSEDERERKRSQHRRKRSYSDSEASDDSRRHSRSKEKRKRSSREKSRRHSKHHKHRHRESYEKEPRKDKDGHKYRD